MPEVTYTIAVIILGEWLFFSGLRKETAREVYSAFKNYNEFYSIRVFEEPDKEILKEITGDSPNQ